MVKTNSQDLPSDDFQSEDSPRTLDESIDCGSSTIDVNYNTLVEEFPANILETSFQSSSKAIVESNFISTSSNVFIRDSNPNSGNEKLTESRTEEKDKEVIRDNPYRDIFKKAFPEQQKPQILPKEDAGNSISSKASKKKVSVKENSEFDNSVIIKFKAIGFEYDKCWGDDDSIVLHNVRCNFLALYNKVDNSLLLMIGSNSIKVNIDFTQVNDDWFDLIKEISGILENKEPNELALKDKIKLFKNLLILGHDKINIRNFSFKGLNLFGLKFVNSELVQCEFVDSILELHSANFISCSAENSDLIVSGKINISKKDHSKVSQGFGDEVYFHTRRGELVELFSIGKNVIFHSNIIDITSDESSPGVVYFEDLARPSNIQLYDNAVVRDRIMRHNSSEDIFVRKNPEDLKIEIANHRFNLKKTIQLMADSPFYEVETVQVSPNGKEKVFKFKDKFFKIKKYSKDILISDSPTSEFIKVEGSEIEFINQELLFSPDSLKGIFSIESK